MKVLHVITNADIGGIERLVAQICRELRVAHGATSDILCTMRGEGTLNGYLHLNGKKGSRIYKRCLDGDGEAHLIALSCSNPPEGRSQWSVRLLADKMVELGYVNKISPATVCRMLKKMNLSLGKNRVG